MHAYGANGCVNPWYRSNYAYLIGIGTRIRARTRTKRRRFTPIVEQQRPPAPHAAATVVGSLGGHRPTITAAEAAQHQRDGLMVCVKRHDEREGAAQGPSKTKMRRVVAIRRRWILRCRRRRPSRRAGGGMLTKRRLWNGGCGRRS